jgi:hypothetical protein
MAIQAEVDTFDGCACYAISIDRPIRITRVQKGIDIKPKNIFNAHISQV